MSKLVISLGSTLWYSMSNKNYSIVDMVVLGILQREPMNAYRLTRFIEKFNVTRLVKLSTPAIYKSCKRLFEKKFLSGKLRRDGEAPEKMIYTVTSDGREYFLQLMNHFAGTITPFYFDINSVVYSLEQLSFAKGLELIDTYTGEIDAIQSWLIPHAKEVNLSAPFGNRMIVLQYLMVVEVLAKWIIRLRKEFIIERG